MCYGIIMKSKLSLVVVKHTQLSGGKGRLISEFTAWKKKMSYKFACSQVSYRQFLN